MQNPESAKKSFDFILHHETAHLFHGLNHPKKPYLFLVGAGLISMAGAALLLIGTGYFLMIGIPILLGITAFTVGYLAIKILTKKGWEWEADRTALHVTRDIEGPVYWLEQIKAQLSESRKDPKAPWYSRILITSSGNYLPRAFTHQLESNRIESLKREYALLAHPLPAVRQEFVS